MVGHYKHIPHSRVKNRCRAYSTLYIFRDTKQCRALAIFSKQVSFLHTRVGGKHAPLTRGSPITTSRLMRGRPRTSGTFTLTGRRSNWPPHSVEGNSSSLYKILVVFMQKQTCIVYDHTCISFASTQASAVLPKVTARLSQAVAIR